MQEKYPFEIIHDGSSFAKIEHVLVGPKKYFLPKNFTKFGEAFYNFEPRCDDIWLFGQGRSGTTLTQELVWLIANDLDYKKASESVLDNRFPFIESILFMDEKKILKLAETNNINDNVKNIAYKYKEHSIYFLEKTNKRRFIKSHIAMSLFSPKLWSSGCKIIYCNRDPRDVIVSYYHFYRSFFQDAFQMDFKQFWNLFKNNKTTFLPYFEHLKEALDKINEKNFLFLRYEETNRNKRETIKKIAKFLDKELTEEQVDKLEEHVQIDKFRKNKSVNNDHLVDLGMMTNNENDYFIRNGKIGEWRKYFTGKMEKEAQEWIENNLKDTSFSFN